MIVNSTIKNKRIKEMRNLYDLIVKDNENYKETLYKIIKETIEEANLEEKIINNIYDALTNAMGLTLEEARKMYKSFDESRRIELEHLLYSKDGKTLEQRIHSWMGEKNIMNLFYHLCLILDTETYQVIHQTIKQKVNVNYVEIIGEGGCDTEKNARGETANTEEGRIADFRTKIAAEKAATGKEYLSFYHVVAESYEINE